MKFCMLRNVRLHEDGALLRIESGREKVQSDLKDVLFELAGICVIGRQRMVVSDEEIALILVLQLHPVIKRAHIVAEVQFPRGTHAAKNAEPWCRRIFDGHSVQIMMIREISVL